MAADFKSWARSLELGSARVKPAVRASLARTRLRLLDLARRNAARAPSAYRSSLRAVADGDSATLSATHPAARAFERGGTIRGAPWLAIPMRGVHAAGPRSDIALVRIRLRDGRVYLIGRQSAELRWRLVDSVRSPVRAPLGDAAAQARRELQRDLLDGVARAVSVTR